MHTSDSHVAIAVPARLVTRDSTSTAYLCTELWKRSGPIDTNKDPSIPKRWKDLTTAPLVPHCQRHVGGTLTPRQQAVYMYLCVRWALFAECDYQQEVSGGSLDEAGQLRRARFLAHDICPLSPATLLNGLGLISGGRQRSCSQEPRYTGDDGTQLYEAEIKRTVCLLGDYMFDNGSFNFIQMVSQASANINEKYDALYRAGKFKDAGTERLELHSDRLRKVVNHCADLRTGPSDLSAEEFVRCWARRGVFDCAKTEAQRVAKSAPESCSY